MFAEKMFLVCGPKSPFRATNTTNSFEATLGHYVAMLSDKKIRIFLLERLVLLVVPFTNCPT
jgi:hypothetical protein